MATRMLCRILLASFRPNPPVIPKTATPSLLEFAQERQIRSTDQSSVAQQRLWLAQDRSD